MNRAVGRGVLVACFLGVVFACSSTKRDFGTKASGGDTNEAGAAGEMGTTGLVGGGGGLAGGGGGFSAGESGTSDATAGVGGEGGEAPDALHTLELLAGKPGAQGNLDGKGADARLFGSGLFASDESTGSLYIADGSSIAGPSKLRKLDLFTDTLSTTAWPTAIGLVADGHGGLFFASRDDVVRHVSSSGTVTVLAGSPNSPGVDDGIGPAARFNFTSGLAVPHVGMTLSGPSDDLFIADTGNNTIRQIVVATGEVTTVAGSPGVSGSADGTGADARFSWPTAIASAPGSLFIVDQGNSTIRAFHPIGGDVRTVAGAAGQTGFKNGAGADARFSSLRALAADTMSLYIADGSTIRRMEFTNFYPVTTLAGVANIVASVDGPVADARFGVIGDLTFDSSGNLLVADTASIRQIDPLLTTVQTLVGAAPATGSTDGSGKDARFNGPGGLVADEQGNVFLADIWNETIREISRSGQVSTLAGSPGVTGKLDGTGPAASFWLQSNGGLPGAGLVLDAMANLFVTDSGNGIVRQIETTSRKVTTASGARGFPSGIVFDGADLFVADRQTNQIERLSLDAGVWTVATLAGGSAGSKDGTGPAAQFKLTGPGMTGIASDGHGTLFVSDASNHTIRQVVVATREVTTLAGMAGISGSDDGVGTDARFFLPSGVATDGKGNLYIADFGNSTLRKLVIATREVSTVVGVPGARGLRLGPLPASLNSPTGVAVLKDGGILISDFAEDAILVVR